MTAAARNEGGIEVAQFQAKYRNRTNKMRVRSQLKPELTK